MSKLNIAVTGYFGTGSSAVIDLLKEYKNVSVVPEVGHLYEHSIFYYPGGLFDLYSLMSNGNTPQGSDIYINNFLETIHRLNDYNYVWYGSYKKLFGDSVLNMSYDFVNSISEKRDSTNSYHNLKTRFSIIKALLQFASRIVYKRNIVQYGVHYVKDGNPVYFAMPSQIELDQACQKFTTSYLNLFSKGDDSISVYDHLIWPQQVNSHQNCFDNNLKIIVVNRDPRDVFLSSKYFWCKAASGGSVGKPHFGDDPNKFSKEWERTVVRDNTNKNALHVNFEDLIYNYDETVELIEGFLGLSHTDHLLPKTKFNPDKSIENTQVFNVNSSWKLEADIISEQLSDYLYDFPYHKETFVSKMFDSQY